jgi:penicillin-binding protein 2
MALNSAIGQGDDNVTPLQLAMVYAAIGNGGTLYKPQLVERLEGLDGEVLAQNSPETVRQVEIPKAHLDAVKEGLIATAMMPGGTAYRAMVQSGLKETGIQVAGKTGTAQVSALGAVRLKTHQMDFFQRDHAWFAGFAPAHDPELAVVVINEHGGHGGADAAPTAMAVIKKYFDLKKEDAANPPPRQNTPYVPVLSVAPSADGISLTRGGAPVAGGNNAAAH